MFGLLLTGGAMFLDEVGTTIGKWQAALRKESVFTMGFLNSLWGTILLLLFAFFVPANFFAHGFPTGFVFVSASLPFFIPRMFLEIAQAHVTVIAIMKADRSTYGFLRILTIPLLLVADILLAYPVSLAQITGMTLIIVSLIFLFINHGIKKQGLGLVIFTAINAVITISLFKYDITHFNSVAAEQAIVSCILVFYFFFMAFFVAKENPLRFLGHPIFFAQSSLMGVGSVILSFAYIFASASVITTAVRAFSILFAMISGNFYFHEKKPWVKILSFLLILAGLVLLA